MDSRQNLAGMAMGEGRGNQLYLGLFRAQEIANELPEQ